jgi:hypothetical protein
VNSWVIDKALIDQLFAERRNDLEADLTLPRTPFGSVTRRLIPAHSPSGA